LDIAKSVALEETIAEACEAAAPIGEGFADAALLTGRRPPG
jgi:hypothetical protein